MYEAVFFDLDGTLYLKRGMGVRLVCAALSGGRLSADGPLRPLACLRLLALERKVRRALAGHAVGYDALFAGIASRAGMDPDAVRMWYDGWYMPAMVAALQKHYTLYEPVVSKARMFKAAGCKIAVLSDYGCVREKIEALGGDPALFDALLDAPSLGGFKPCPDVFRAACSSLSADPARCALVGDRRDTDGGCVAVGMTYIPR